MPTLKKEVLHAVTAAIFRATGAPDDLAVQVADVLIDNHLAGHDSHGILRIPEYVQNVRAGEIVPAARPRVIEESATSALVSGNWAFGQVTGVFAADLATEKAKRERVAVLSVVQAGHTGRLAAFTERAARRDVAMFMAIGTVNKPTTAPYGGSAAVLGTNPISFSIPNPAGAPVTLDFATSAIAAGKIKAAKAKHERLPPDAILDSPRAPLHRSAGVLRRGIPAAVRRAQGLRAGGHRRTPERSPGRRRRVSGRDQPERDLHFCGGRGRLSAARRTTKKRWPRRSAGSRPCRPARVSRKCCCRASPKPAPAQGGSSDGIPIPDDTWRAVVEAGAELGVNVESFIP